MAPPTFTRTDSAHHRERFQVAILSTVPATVRRLLRIAGPSVVPYAASRVTSLESTEPCHTTDAPF